MVYHNHLWRWLLPGKITITLLWKHSWMTINYFSYHIAWSSLKWYMSEAHQLKDLLCSVETCWLSANTEFFPSHCMVKLKTVYGWSSSVKGFIVVCGNVLVKRQHRIFVTSKISCFPVETCQVWVGSRLKGNSS